VTPQNIQSTELAQTETHDSKVLRRFVGSWPGTSDVVHRQKRKF